MTLFLPLTTTIGMIIIEVDSKPRQHQHQPQLELPSGSVHSPPPSYHYHPGAPLLGHDPESSSYPKPLPASVVRYPYPNPNIIPYDPHRPTSPRKRFCGALTIALIIYLVLLGFTHTVVRMAGAGIHHYWDGASVGVPPAEDGHILDSIGAPDWTTYRARPWWAPGPEFAMGAETSFVLPVDAEEMYLVSRGTYQAGRVEVRQAEEGAATDEVRVDVRVAYQSERALARARVCRLQKSGNRDGVGIYTPTPPWSDARDRLYFEVVFTFPAARHEDESLRIKAFSTRTSNFAHEIGDLWQSMTFGNVQVQASNAPIRAQSITLAGGSLVSSNGAITGHFNTSDALTLRTSNAHIQATASLFNANRDTTKLEMRTSNSPITASVSLVTPSGSSGAFAVSARSSNGAIKLQYDESPLRARLVSDVRTSNGPVEVAMHPAFEGTYEVSTSNGRPVVRDTHPLDPSGAGRRRIVHQTATKSIVRGSVYWEGARGGGVSTVQTSNARVSLDL